MEGQKEVTTTYFSKDFENCNVSDYNRKGNLKSKLLKAKNIMLI